MATTKTASVLHAFEATEMIALGLIVLAAHLGGRLCRRLRMSEVTGQLVGGALIGPIILKNLGVLPQLTQALNAFHFFIFLFLSLVAFGIGEELHLDRLAKVGRKALIISLTHAAITCVLMTSVFRFLLGYTWLESLLFGSTGIASAPAVTFVLMNQLSIEGRLRHLMGSVVVLVDLVEILVFSLVVQLLLKGQTTAPGAVAVLPVLQEVGFALLLGLAIYILLRLLVGRHATSLAEENEPERQQQLTPDANFLQRMLAEHPSPSAEIFVVIVGSVAVGSGIAYLEEWPFLITAITAGFLVANFHSQAIFDSLKIENLTPVLNLVFFALMGASLPFEQFQGATLAAAVAYAVTRSAGKLIGTWAGCRLAGEDMKVTQCLPLLLLPQAGVSAVEAVFASAVLGDPRYASIILPAIVFFQIAGVFLADRALRRWRSWVADEENAMKSQTGLGGQAEAARRLLAALAPERLLLDLQGTTKSEVLEALVDAARRSSPQHIDRAQALQLLGERERLAPTGFGHGIAVPHCRLMGLEQPVMVCGRHTDGGIVFGGVDDEPCDLIFMFLSAARNPGEHLRLLAATAHVFGDEATRAQFRAAPTPQACLHLLEALATGSTPQKPEGDSEC